MSANLAWLHPGTLLAALVVGVLTALVVPRRSRSLRFTAVVLPPLLVATAWTWATTILVRPVLSTWSGPRLIPAAAWIRGFPMYPLPGEGPITGWIYPPVGALAYLPAAVINDPVTALLIGRGLSLLFVFGPVAWVLAAEARRGRIAAATAPILFVLFAYLAQEARSLRYVATEILADAPALGFLAVAMIAVGRLESVRSRAWGVVAVVATILAAWSKQLEAFLGLVPILAAWWVGGWRLAARLSAVFAGVAVGMAALFAAMFGPRNLLFQLVEVPRHHPFRVADWREAVAQLERGTADGFEIFVLLILATVGLLALRLLNRSPTRPGGLGGAWLPFLAAALLETPLAVLGYLKLGGDVNSLAHAIYPATIAAVLALGRLTRQLPGGGLIVACVTVVLLIPGQVRVAALCSGREPSWNDELARGMNWRAEERAIAAAIRERPGLYYFPTYPLASLLIDGRLGHFEYGVFDLQLAGMPLSEQELRRGVPQSARYLCYPGGRSFTLPDHFLKRALPEFSRPVRLPELPFCECYERVPPPPDR